MRIFIHRDGNAQQNNRIVEGKNKTNKQTILSNSLINIKKQAKVAIYHLLSIPH